MDTVVSAFQFLLLRGSLLLAGLLELSLGSSRCGSGPVAGYRYFAFCFLD